MILKYFKIHTVKSPTADVTWTKGAKRQMANLDRFLEELQSFDQHELTENTIKLLQDLDKKIESYDPNETISQSAPHFEALITLHKWTKGVLKYNSLMIHRVKPLHQKVEDIEKEVKEADQKLTTLNRKSEVNSYIYPLFDPILFYKLLYILFLQQLGIKCTPKRFGPEFRGSHRRQRGTTRKRSKNEKTTANGF